MSFQAGEKYSLDGHDGALFCAMKEISIYGRTYQEFICLKGRKVYTKKVYTKDVDGKRRGAVFRKGCKYRFLSRTGEYKQNPYFRMSMTPVSGADEQKVKLLINMAMDSKSDATREELVDTLYRVLFTPSGLSLSQGNR